MVDVLTEAKPLVRESSPVVDLGRRPDMMWLRPVLVAEITYEEIVEGRLRAAAFRRVMPGVPDGRSLAVMRY